MKPSKTIRTKIFITGATGFIGSNFLQHIAHNAKVEVMAVDHKTLDILDRKGLKKTFRNFEPNIVINFAAHRNANTAEIQRGDKNGSAWQTNVVGLKNIFRLCQAYKSYLIHISTDMVFLDEGIIKGHILKKKNQRCTCAISLGMVGRRQKANEYF